MSTPQPPGAVLQHTGRPREEDIPTRKRMSLWDHVKWLVLLAIVWLVLVFSLMGDNPLIGFLDACRMELGLASWVWALFAAEFLHQLHFVISERSARYSDSGLSRYGLIRRWPTCTCINSPAAMYSFAWRTAAR